MSAEDGPPDLPDISGEWQEVWENRSTRERMYAVALQLYEPARVAAVAERAEVSKETAREYLQWFAELGMLDREAESPALFSRNESYFRWRRVQRLRSRPPEELTRELRDLAEKEREFRNRFGEENPDTVDALEHAGYDELDAVWMELSEWNTVRRRMREIEQARREGHRPTETTA